MQTRIAVRIGILTLAAGLHAQQAQVNLETGSGNPPLLFEPIRSESTGATFAARGEGYTLLLHGSEATLRFPRASSTGFHDVSLRWVGANPGPAVSGLDLSSSRTNYLIGKPENWRTNVANYLKVQCAGLYPGVDIVYYGKHRQLEYDLIVNSGADLRHLELEIHGANGIELDDDGGLVIHTVAGDLEQRRPDIYQVIDGRRRAVSGNM